MNVEKPREIGRGQSVVKLFDGIDDGHSRPQPARKRTEPVARPSSSTIDGSKTFRAWKATGA